MRKNLNGLIEGTFKGPRKGLGESIAQIKTHDDYTIYFSDTFESCPL